MIFCLPSSISLSPKLCTFKVFRAFSCFFCPVIVIFRQFSGRFRNKSSLFNVWAPSRDPSWFSPPLRPLEFDQQDDRMLAHYMSLGRISTPLNCSTATSLAKRPKPTVEQIQHVFEEIKAGKLPTLCRRSHGNLVLRINRAQLNYRPPKTSKCLLQQILLLLKFSLQNPSLKSLHPPSFHTPITIHIHSIPIRALLKMF